jgi:hypothetical protein
MLNLTSALFNIFLTIMINSTKMLLEQIKFDNYLTPHDNFVIFMKKKQGTKFLFLIGIYTYFVNNYDIYI